MRIIETFFPAQSQTATQGLNCSILKINPLALVVKKKKKKKDFWIVFVPPVQKETDGCEM